MGAVSAKCRLVAVAGPLLGQVDIQSTKKAHDIGWKPTHLLNVNSASRASF
jgi:hypothetical protein